MNLGLAGKKVLITASSSGIGLQTARLFYQEGAYVIINGRNKEKLINLKKELDSENGRGTIEVFAGDMCQQENIISCKRFIEEKWNGLDILIPNVGTGKALSEDRLDITEWEYMMEHNLFSTVKLIHAFEALLEKGKQANIVMVSSVVACERANAPYAYAASKGSILTLNSYLAGDFAKKNIRVNCVLPGNVFFEGGRWEELLRADEAGVKSYINENVPMKRFAKPEEIANTIVFLASQASSFTTGAAVTIDGGQKRSL